MGCSVCVCVWGGGGAIRHSLNAFRSLQAQRLRGMLAPGPRAKGAAAWQGRTGLVVHLMQGPGAGTPGTQLLTGQLAAIRAGGAAGAKNQAESWWLTFISSRLASTPRSSRLWLTRLRLPLVEGGGAGACRKARCRALQGLAGAGGCRHHLVQGTAPCS